MADAEHPARGRLLTSFQAAQRLQVSLGHVTWLAKQGYVKGEKVDSRLLVDEASVDEYAADRAKWVSYDTAAELIGCSRWTVKLMIDDDRLATRPRRGTRRRIELASVHEQAEAWPAEVERREREAAERAAVARAASSRPPDDGHVYLGSATTALLLGISTSRLHQLLAIDRVPHMRRNRRVWFRRDHVELLAAARAAARQRRAR